MRIFLVSDFEAIYCWFELKWVTRNFIYPLHDVIAYTALSVKSMFNVTMQEAALWKRESQITHNLFSVLHSFE